MVALAGFPLGHLPAAFACGQPPTVSIDAAFDLASNGVATAPFPATKKPAIRTAPASILKTIGWMESRWEQYTPAGRPLVSSDFGYGIMQVTSGMAGAFGDPRGTIPPSDQSRIASNYAFNIAYGAAMLRHFFMSTPRIGTGDPAVLENWYYAVWAYNAWGWINNPNNPRFSHRGTPATDPAGFPYQDQVFYYVAHPPRDTNGNPLWAPVPVAVPSRSQIGTSAGSYAPKTRHRQPPLALSAAYSPGALRPALPGQTQTITVQLTNTGTSTWLASAGAPIRLVYHVFTRVGNPWGKFSPFSPGVVAFAQRPLPVSASVPPGKTVTVRASIKPPSVPGTYRVVWDLQVGADTWLSQSGVTPHVQQLRVYARGQPVPPSVVPPASSPGLKVHAGLVFIADTAAGDGFTVMHGRRFTKGWLVYNNSHSPWLPGMHLKLHRGKAFGAKSLSVPATPACSTVNILATLQAPPRPGTYHSAWRLTGPNGNLEGDALTVVARVR